MKNKKDYQKPNIEDITDFEETAAACGGKAGGCGCVMCVNPGAGPSMVQS